MSKRLPAGHSRLNCNHCSHNFSASLRHYEYDEYGVECDDEYDDLGVEYDDKYDERCVAHNDEYDDTSSDEYDRGSRLITTIVPIHPQCL